MIKFDNVAFSYGKKKILNNFNLSIADKQHICLFAPSGYGKTTVLRLLLGLEKPKSGKIRGLENKTFSVVFQEDRLLNDKTVYENLSLFGGSERIEEILGALGIADSANLYPSELSGGMARRVAIARAINRNGDIFILDEPFNGIDKDNLEKTARFISENTKDKILIVVSHNPYEAELLDAEIVNI